MKKILTLVAALSIVFLTVRSQDLKHFFNIYKNDSRFESVSVGKFLIKLPLLFSDLTQSDKELLANINRIKVLSSNSALDPEFSTNVLKDLQKIIDIGNLDNIVSVRDKTDRINVYCRVSGNQNSDLLVVVKDQNEMNVIWINGKLTDEMIHKFQDELASNSSNILTSLH